MRFPPQLGWLLHLAITVSAYFRNVSIVCLGNVNMSIPNYSSDLLVLIIELRQYLFHINCGIFLLMSFLYFLGAVMVVYKLHNKSQVASQKARPTSSSEDCELLDVQPQGDVHVRDNYQNYIRLALYVDMMFTR